MAVSYYWPNPWQIRLNYRLPSSEVNGRVPELWTVSYKDENSQGIEVVFRDVYQVPKGSAKLRVTLPLRGVCLIRFGMRA